MIWTWQEPIPLDGAQACPVIPAPARIDDPKQAGITLAGKIEEAVVRAAFHDKEVSEVGVMIRGVGRMYESKPSLYSADGRKWWAIFGRSLAEQLQLELEDRGTAVETLPVVHFDHVKWGPRRKPENRTWLDSILVEPLRDRGLRGSLYGGYTGPVFFGYRDLVGPESPIDEDEDFIPWVCAIGAPRGNGRPPMSREEFIHAWITVRHRLGAEDVVIWCNPNLAGAAGHMAETADVIRLLDGIEAPEATEVAA